VPFLCLKSVEGSEALLCPADAAKVYGLDAVQSPVSKVTAVLRDLPGGFEVGERTPFLFASFHVHSSAYFLE
jgi:hypothetical protein